MKRPAEKILPGKRVPLARRITLLVPGAVFLMALGWIAFDLDEAQRMILVRYLAMGFAGCMAFITPHLLFPDRDKTLAMQLNLSGRMLFLHHLSRLRTVWFFAVLALAVLVFADASGPSAELAGKKTRLLGSGLLALTSIMMYALYRFTVIGETSQRLKEGAAGKKTLSLLHMIGRGAAADTAMFPTFFSTILVTFVGMMAVVLSASIPHELLSIIPFLLFGAYAFWRLSRIMGIYDRLYYQSDAFFDELFTNPVTATGESREPASYRAVYWVPHYWRPAVWAQIVQLDRRRPMGRIIALLSILYWLLIWLGLPESWYGAWILFWILSKNMLAWPLTGQRISPAGFHHWLMSPFHWIFVRFFLQIRWTPALAATLSVAALFSTSVSWTVVVPWVLTDLLSSLVTAMIITRNNEYAFLKQYA